MKPNVAQLICLALVLLSFGLAFAMYGALPDPVPSHWNAAGEIDGFMPKPWGVLILPLATTCVWLLLLAIPKISPRGFGVERFRGAYDLITVTLVGFLFVVTAIALLAAGGTAVPVVDIILAATGLLFVVLGAAMPRMTRNYFVGIRTPWTLTNDEVWARTHQLGGKLFVAAGAATLLAGLAGWGIPVLIVAAIVAGVIPVAYSYVIYKSLDSST